MGPRGCVWLALALGCSSTAGTPDAGRADAGESDAPFVVDAPPAVLDAPDAGPPPPGDTCASAIDADVAGTIDADGTLRVRVTTTAARDDVVTCDMPVGIEIGDVVVRWIVPERGALAVGLETVGSPSRFEYDVRTACDDVTSSLDCDRCGVTCGHRFDDVAAGEEIFVVVTQILTAPSGSGDVDVTFTLEPFLATGEACARTTGPRCTPEDACQDDGSGPVCGPAVCGDGFVGFTLLECDDGNLLPGDGCTATCEPAAQGDGAPDCVVPTALAMPLVRMGDALARWGLGAGEIGGTSDRSASCAAADGPEAVYSFAVAERSRVEVSSTGADVLSVHAAGCSTELGCTSGDPASRMLVLDPLDPGVYTVVLDRTIPTATTGTAYEVGVIVTPL